MSSLVTSRGHFSIISGAVNLTSNTIKVMLLNSSYTPSIAHGYIADVSAYELSGTGYVGGFNGSGRKTLASKTFSESSVGDGVSVFDAADLSWSAITAGTFKYAALVKEVTTDADSIVIGIVQFAELATNGSTLNLAWSPNGIFRITAWAGEITNVRVVSYVATGAEGVDFNVPIGTTLAADDYSVFWSPAGVVNFPVPDLPTGADSDRTTTTFRVTLADSLSAGDILKFLVVE